MKVSYAKKTTLSPFCSHFLLAVYTRNRNFRLYLSSKLGKDVHLKLAKENKFVSRYGEDSRRSRHFNILMDSLVCNVR